MAHLGRVGLVSALSLLAATACSLFTGLDEAYCPATGGPEHHGCVRFLVLLDGPPEPLPPFRHWIVDAYSADTLPRRVAIGSVPREGQSDVTLYLWAPLRVEAGDTASFWVVAKLLEQPAGWPDTLPLPVFAADSALRLVDFARLTEAPMVDTVRLRPRSGGGP